VSPVFDPVDIDLLIFKELISVATLSLRVAPWRHEAAQRPVSSKCIADCREEIVSPRRHGDASSGSRNDIEYGNC